jgi:DNA-binding MarR family transcriptional regulator
LGVAEPSPDSTQGEALTLASELRIVLSKLTRKLKDHSQIGDLTWAQVSVLSRLDREGPATVSALARAEGMRQQSMGANISALEAAGFVKGTPDPNDGRQTILHLTEACREWIRTNRIAKEDRLLRAIQATLNSEEQQTLARSVELIKRLAEF